MGKMSTALDVTVQNPDPTSSQKADVKADNLKAIVAFCRDYAIHPRTKDRTARGVSSRIARGLNATFGHNSCRGSYWTGPDVLALAVKEGFAVGE